MTEYEQLAREAEARKGWDLVIKPQYSTIFSDKYDGAWVVADIARGLESDAQFILDTIRLLPQLVRELQEAKAKAEALVDSVKRDREKIAEYLDNEEEHISKALRDYQHPLNPLDDEQTAREQGKMEILNELAQWLRGAE